MSTFLDDETLTLYIEESKEHLATIEADLLELEKQGEHFSEELVNKIFRAAHSIKGGGGFLGLTTIKELAHKIENALHQIRTNQLVPDSNLINTLLHTYDRLGTLIDNPGESNQMDISEPITRLEHSVAVAQKQGKGEQVTVMTDYVIHHPQHNLSFVVKENVLKQSRQGGKLLYLLDFDLVRDVHQQNKTPLDIITLLQDSGSIIDIHTDISLGGDLLSNATDPSLPMCVLFSSIVERDLVGIMFNLKEHQIHPIANDQIKPLEQEQAALPVSKVSEVKEPAPAIKPDQPTDHISESASTDSSLQPNAKPFTNLETAAKQAPVTSETLRVHVRILDQLMNKAGELVLARNQLVQSIQSWNQQQVMAAGQWLDLVTSELQETIMLTRMQPIGIVFNKFPRVARGLAMDLGKKIELQLEGTDVEMDKTIIEGLADPLTHLVRNSADHGIELPDVRERKGKPRTGHILLRAYYESGQVMIEIRDDGKGLDTAKITEKAVAKGIYTTDEISALSEKEKFNLIMLPGFSTAEKVTDVSGRGVGMDVVRTNLDKLGGQIELISVINQGTTIRIKLPLTLAIIPSLLVQATGERFALPQANVSELLRIPAAEIRERIEKIGEADVLILRGELIPLLQLNNLLSLKPTYYDFKAGCFRPDRRSGIIDQRLLATPGSEAESTDITATDAANPVAKEQTPERRNRRESDCIIAILNDGSQKYGLIVDAVSDSVEIVVKPLGRHLAKNKAYAGATIMGDGHVTLILDVHGIAELAELKAVAESDPTGKQESGETKTIAGATRQTLLTFHNGPDETCAVPLGQVLRVEQIRSDTIEIKGGKKIIQYRGRSLTVYALEEVANVEMLEAREKLIVIVFAVAGNEVGLLAVQPLDVVDQTLILDDKTLRQPGIAGSTIIDGKTTLLVDIYELVKIVNPHWFQTTEAASGATPEAMTKRTTVGDKILLVEDSQFFRNQVKKFMEDAGYGVVEAEDGQQAWNYLNESPNQVSMVVTDLEMPIMDGFELTRQLKSDPRFRSLPVIALTSLAADENIKKGKDAGIDDYQIKLDKERLLEAIRNRFGK